MEALRILLGIGIASPLLRQHMEKHRFILLPGPGEHLRQLLHIVAIHRPHVGKAHFFKHGALRQQGIFKPMLHMGAGPVEILLDGIAVLQLFFIPFFEIIIPLLGTQPGQMVAQTADISINGHAVIIEYYDHGLPGSTGIIEPLKAQAAGHGSVTNEGDDAVILTEQRSGVGHAQSNRHRVGRMAGHKGIVNTLMRLWKAGKTAHLPQSTEK